MRIVLLAAAAVCILSSPSFSQITNGDFTNGLTGWTPAQTQNGHVVPDLSFGNPAPCVRLYATSSLFGAPLGSASVSQDFACGQQFGGGSCNYFLEYFYAASNNVIKIEVLIDGNPVYSNNVTGYTSAWTPIVGSVPCGNHTITVSAEYVSGTLATDWFVRLDNISAFCEETISVEPSTWGVIKSLWRD